MQNDRLVGEFTHQAESFNASEAANARPPHGAFRKDGATLTLRRWAGRFRRPAGPSPG